MNFSVVDQFLQQKKTSDFFPNKAHMGRGGVGVRVRVRISV